MIRAGPIPHDLSGYRTAVTHDSQAFAPFDTVVLDIDGTLVDSVYAHVWSWREAFRVVGVDVPTWKVHRAIGMGGDRLVEAVSNAAVEHSLGEEIRGRQAELYHGLSTHLRPTEGATELLAALKTHGLKVVLASSGAREDTNRSVALLEAASQLDGTISGDDADATKPDDEPVRRAVDSVDGRRALVIGDAVWDMESARRAGHTAIGLRSGGVADCELLGAGASAVYDDPAALTAALADVLSGQALDQALDRITDPTH
jgi:HAD superfamily hydrolase (TIGR01549 family)